MSIRARLAAAGAATALLAGGVAATPAMADASPLGASKLTLSVGGSPTHDKPNEWTRWAKCAAFVLDWSEKQGLSEDETVEAIDGMCDDLEPR